MIRSELVAKLAADRGISEYEARTIVKTFFSSIGILLAQDGRLELRGFGSFGLRKRQSRTVKTPRTGESVEVKQRFIPTFKPGKKIRQMIRDQNL